MLLVFVSAPIMKWRSTTGISMHSKRLELHELNKISTETLSYYEQRAEDFRAGTRDHDVSQNIDALLRHIEGESPLVILDFGCGPGRDLKTFAGLGRTAIGLEGAARFVAMARADTGCEVWHQDFHRLNLPAKHFDGIFANASLFHVPSQELPRVVATIARRAEAGGGAVQFQSARPERGRLESPALRSLPRP